MSWKKYDTKESAARPIRISDVLYDAIKRFSKEKGYTQQAIFNAGLGILWREYNGYTTSVEPKDGNAEKDLRILLMNNTMPKGKAEKKISLAFRGEVTFQWVLELERLYVYPHGMEDFIRRVLTWYTREMGFLKKDEKSFFKK